MSEEAGPQEVTSESGGEAEARALVVLADLAEAASDEEAEALSESLGREIVVLDPGFLDPEAFERIEEAAAVVVSWDLGSQAGLDVLEALRGDERVEGTPILMSSPEPTPGAVRLALQAGANGFLFEPLSADELRDHLPVEEPADPPAAAEPEAAEAAPEEPEAAEA